MNPREVLVYLNDLGYTNITSEQLRNFMIDLKKLIKYEERLRDETDGWYSPPPVYDIFEQLYNAGTVASKAKIVKQAPAPKPKSENCIMVEIQRPKSTCATKSQQTDASVQAISSSSSSSTARPCSCPTSLPSTARTQTIDRRPKSAPVESKSKKIPKPKTSFLRPKVNCKPPKSDPVALYHQYQEEWKKMKIPGSDNHADLRWAIRAKLINDREDYCF